MKNLVTKGGTITAVWEKNLGPGRQKMAEAEMLRTQWAAVWHKPKPGRYRLRNVVGEPPMLDTYMTQSLFHPNLRVHSCYWLVEQKLLAISCFSAWSMLWTWTSLWTLVGHGISKERETKDANSTLNSPWVKWVELPSLLRNRVWACQLLPYLREACR